MGGWSGVFSQKPKLLEELAAQFPKKEKVEPLALDNPKSVIRCSSLPYMCAREEVIASLLGVTRTRTVNLDNVKSMGLGREWHRTLQNHLLGPGGKILGEWRCERCCRVVGTFPGDMVKKPDKCPGCGSDGMGYKEPTLKDEALRISGHVDGVIAPKWYEFKTTGSSWWFQQCAAKPDAKHVAQAMLYGDLLIRHGVLVNVLELVYIDVTTAPKSLADGMVTHEIKFDKDIVAVQRAKAKSILDGIAEKKLPPRTCQAKDCKESKACGLSDVCWTNDDTVDVG